MSKLDKHKAIVVLSGGQDSTTCLYWAKKKWPMIYALTFDYRQRHVAEIESACRVAAMAGVWKHEVLPTGPLLHGSSPLTDPAGRVEEYEDPGAMPGGIEPTFVPCRNLLFLTLAYNRAIVNRASAVVIGVCEEDYGGYPDCRQVFLTAFDLAAFLATHDGRYSTTDGPAIVAPLMNMTKCESVGLAKSLPGCLDALAYTHTCYHGEYPPNPYNHASMIRARGFDEAGTPDPLIVRAKGEGKLPGDYPDTGYVVGTKYEKGAKDES